MANENELIIPVVTSEAVAKAQLDERIAFSSELAKSEDPAQTEATMGAIANIIHDRIGYPVGETSSSDKHDTVKLPSDDEGGLSFVSVFGGTPAMRQAAVNVLKQDVEGMKDGIITNADQGLEVIEADRPDDDGWFDDEYEDEDDQGADDDYVPQPSAETMEVIARGEAEALQEQVAASIPRAYHDLEVNALGEENAKLLRSAEQRTASLADAAKVLDSVEADIKAHDVLDAREWEDLSLEEQRRLAQLMGAAIADIASVFNVKPLFAEIGIMSQTAFAKMQQQADEGAEQAQRVLSPGDRVLVELTRAAHEGRLLSMHFTTEGGVSMGWNK